MSRSRPVSRHIAAIVVLTALAGCTSDPVSTDTIREEPTATVTTSPRANTLVGHLLLPGERGRRGVEVHAQVTTPDGDSRQLWILPDADGRFAQEFSGDVERVSVSAGSEVHRIDAADLPRGTDNGAIDLGAIDLRESLVTRRMSVRLVDEAPGELVRIGLWIGPPHTGPRGELPSLGSKQFPSAELGSEVEWLLPPDADDIFFIVELSDEPSPSLDWKSDAQYLFGPYETSAFPLELVLE